MANNLLSPVTYARITGIALAAVALLGIVMSAAAGGAFVAGFLEFDWTHNIVHVALAGAALAAGFAASGAYAAIYAKIFGIVYAALAVVGFIAPDILGFIGLHLELGENLVHLLIGVYGIAAGFMGNNTGSQNARARAA